MTQPVPTLRIDTSGTAFGAAPTWTDYTTSLVTAGNGEPIEVTRGRADTQSGDVSPAKCTFLLENITGLWTPGNAAAPASWDVGCRVNVRLTVSATVYDRFDGYVDSIEPAWPGGASPWSVVKVSCTDVTARLGISKQLHSAIDEQSRKDGWPQILMPLDEPDGSATAGSLGLATVTASRLDGAYGPGQVKFGEDHSRPDGQTGVRFGPASTAGVAGAVSVLSISKDKRINSLTVPARISLVFGGVTAPPANPMVLYVYSSKYDPAASPTRTFIELRVNTSGYLEMQLVDAFTNETLTGPYVCDGAIHTGGWGLDGGAGAQFVLIADGNITTAVNTYGGIAAEVSQLGGRVIPGATGAQFAGVISSFTLDDSDSVTTAANTQTQQKLLLGTLGERSDQAFSRVAGWAALTTSGLPTGKAIIGVLVAHDATPIELLQRIARTEGTMVYATGAGALTFQARDNRYQKAVGLTLAANDVDGTVTIRRDRQGQINELTVQRFGGAAQLYVDSTRQAADGRMDGGSFDVISSTDEDAYQNAAWQVNNHKTPQTRLLEVAVNLMTMPDATVQSCLTADISTVVRVTGLPAQAPASTFIGFVEGWTEHIGAQEWSISYFTSPVLLEDNVLVLDDSTFGVLNSTNVLAF